MKASEIMTSVFGNLVKEFYEKVNWELYDIAREKGSCDFEIDCKELSTDVLEFMSENEIPSCKVGMKQIDEWHYDIIINGANWKEFDWEISEEVERLHADDWQISKDEMYD